MIRFIDLSQDYWTDPEENGGPICAFLNTVDDRFLENVCGSHTFSDLEGISEHPQGQRMAALVPVDFFQQVTP